MSVFTKQMPDGGLAVVFVHSDREVTKVEDLDGNKFERISMTVDQALRLAEEPDGYEQALTTFEEWREAAKVLAAEIRKLQG